MTEARVATVETRAHAREHLTFMDSWYRERLKGVSLVAELGVEHEEAKELARYAAVATSSMRMNRKGEYITEYWPAAWVVAVAGLAVEGYQHGGYWPALRDVMDGYIQSDLILPAIKDAYLKSLEVLDLPVTRDAGHQLYISNVVLHSGIPNYCLADWFRMLFMAAHQVGDEVESVIPWCRQRLDSSSLSFVDRPIRLMLEYGDEFAFDLADRSLSALSLALDGDSVDFDDPTYFASVALPKRFTDALVVEMRREGVKSSSAGKRRRRRAVPQIELETSSGDVLVALPPVPDADDSFSWLLKVDDQASFRVNPEMQWDRGMIGVDACAARITVPARTVRVEGTSLDGSALRLVDPGRPVLAFDPSGRRISPFTPLPASRVWFVLPSTTRAGATINGQTVPSVAEADPPLGWAGWETVCVDLSSAPSVEFEDPRFVWHVSSQRTASVECQEAIEPVRMDGYSVHARRPLVNLPAEGVETHWRIDVNDAQTGETVLSRESVIQKDAVVDPWEGAQDSVTGLFTIVVRGPLGRGAKRTVAVLEGLEYQAQPEIRMIGLKGLQPAEVVLDAAGFGEKACVKLDQRTAHSSLRFCGQTLQVYPAALAVADAGPDRLPSWTHQPVRIPVEDLHERTLMVRSLDEAELRPWVTCQGVPRQQLLPASRRGTVQTFSLTTILDTVELYGQAHIELRDASDPDSTIIPLAVVAPRALAKGVAIVRGAPPAIHLTEYRPADVECFVWASAAPWLPPHQARPTREGLVLLPSGWECLGDLYVHCRLVDDWDPEPPPRWPTHRDLRAQAVAGLGSPDDGRSRFMLQQEGEPPKLLPSEAWKVLRFLETTKRPVSLDVDRWVTDTLHTDPVESLKVLASLTADPALTAGMIARVGLGSTFAEPQSVMEEASVKLVHQNGLVGAILTGREATGTQAQEIRIALEETLGQPIGLILSGEADPAATGGAFTRESELLEFMPDEQFEDIIKQLGLVPRALLDMDARTQAAISLYLARSGCRRLSRDAHSLTSTVRRLLHQKHFDRAESALDARRHPDNPTGWLALSAASMSYAFAERYAAYGHDEFARALSYFEQWKYLSEGIRPLHAIDLVVAEGYAAADHAGSEGTDGD